jgi:long-chain acyl-CoA synthetase
VVDAVLVGIPHRTLGEVPAAVVTLGHGATASEDDLCWFVASRLAAFKVPVAVAFWPEPLPPNANGKILKCELKMLFAAHSPI